MSVGNEMWTNARPTSAGFHILYPRPPKQCFAMPMATAAATIGTNHRAWAGRQKATRRPVTTALPSPTVILPRRRCVMTASATTADATARPMCRYARMPKKYPAATAAGTSAAATDHMIRATVSSPHRCGQ